MKEKLISVFTLILFTVVFSPVFSQTVEPQPELMRREGMIYVVIGVLVIIFAGIVFYLFLMDRRLKKIENNLNK